MLKSPTDVHTPTRRAVAFPRRPLLCLLVAAWPAAGACGCASPAGLTAVEHNLAAAEAFGRVGDLKRRLAIAEARLARTQAEERQARDRAVLLEQRRRGSREAELLGQVRDLQRNLAATRRDKSVAEMNRKAWAEKAKAAEEEHPRLRAEIHRLQKQIAILQTRHRLALKQRDDRIRELEVGRTDPKRAPPTK